jgi:endonuclease YncB( thermonuclease family)
LYIVFPLFNLALLRYCEAVQRVWIHFPTTIIALVVLVGASAFGWWQSTQSQMEILGASTDSTAELQVIRKVLDGGRLKLDDGQIVHLALISVPGYNHTTSTLDCYAEEVAAFLSRVLTGSQATVVTPAHGQDRYGRDVVLVYYDGALINEVLVNEGLASVGDLGLTTIVTSEIDLNLVTTIERLKSAERSARMQQKGLWAACGSQRRY